MAKRPGDELDELRREGDGVADGDALQSLVARAGADVEELLVQLRRLAALVLRDDVGRPAPDRHACTGPLAPCDDDAAPGQEQRVDAADLVEVDVAVIVDPGDDQTDLVGVADGDDVRRRRRVDIGPQVAQRVSLGLHQRLARGGARRPAPAPSKPLGPGARQRERRNSTSTAIRTPPELRVGAFYQNPCASAPRRPGRRRLLT